MSKIILGSFSALFSKWPVASKWLAVEWNTCMLGETDRTFGLSATYMGCLLTLCLMSFWSKWTVTRIWLAVDWNGLKLGTRCYCNRHMLAAFGLVICKVIWGSFSAFFSELKTADRIVKRSDIWGLEVLVENIHVWGYLEHLEWRSFGGCLCICLKMTCYAKMARHRVKWTDNWA